jgi:DNA replication protein DnaC
MAACWHGARVRSSALADVPRRIDDLRGDMDARELLEVIEDRLHVRATLITSQLPLDNLHAATADPTVADAILNRLVHHAHKLSLKGDSMRKVLGGATSNQGGEEKPRRR